MAKHYMEVDDGPRRTKLVEVELPSNAHNKQGPRAVTEGPPERETPAAVINGKVRRKGKPQSFLADTGRNIWQYVLTDVILPTLKETVYEIITGGSERAIFGEVRRSRPGMTSYNRFARPGGGVTTTPSTNPYANPTTPRTVTRQARATHNFDDIVLESRDEADAVLEGIKTLVQTHGNASVGDLFALCDIESVFTDHQWGWTDREAVNIRIVPVRGGFMIRTPPTVPVSH